MRILWSIAYRILSPLSFLGGMALPSGMMVLTALAVAAVPAAATWHYMSVNHAAELAEVRQKERNECERKLKQVQDTLHDDLLTKLAKAREAEASVVDPKTDKELIEICKRSASCRERGQLK